MCKMSPKHPVMAGYAKLSIEFFSLPQSGRESSVSPTNQSITKKKLLSSETIGSLALYQPFYVNKCSSEKTRFLGV